MEQLESPDPGLVAQPVRLPVQLSLSWGEVTAEPVQPAVQGLPHEQHESPLPAWTGGADAGRERVIEAEARRAKMVCVVLLGLLLAGLRYLDA